MLTIDSYLQQSQGHPEQSLSALLTQAKEKNAQNPAIYRREEEHIHSCQQEAFGKTLQGLPVAIKDNIMLEGTISGCGSRMLEGYVAPYSATVVRRLEQAGAIIVAKAAMDEFAQGSTGENSPYPVPHHPDYSDLVAGGSSSGSAVAVAGGMVPVALGSDTGGSVRLPASLCGIVGFKPTYGAISRYGVQAMAASFNQIGIFGRITSDVKRIFEIIAGPDEYDPITLGQHPKAKTLSVQGLRIGLPKQYFGEGLDPDIQKLCMRSIQGLVDQGATIVWLDIPLLNDGVSLYYTLVPAEVSTDMARFDGLKFGHQDNTQDHESYHHYIQHIRTQGFGEEVIRRILLGAHILSASEYEGLFVKAMDARTLLTQEIKQHFVDSVDVIVGPTCPLVARPKGAKIADPIAMYLADMYCVTANITGMSAMSVPIGRIDKEGKQLPVGLQLMTDHRCESQLFALGRIVERV